MCMEEEPDQLCQNFLSQTQGMLAFSSQMMRRWEITHNLQQIPERLSLLKTYGAGYSPRPVV